MVVERNGENKKNRPEPADMIRLEITLFMKPKNSADEYMQRVGYQSVASALKHALEVSVKGLEEIVDEDRLCIAVAEVRRPPPLEKLVINRQLERMANAGEIDVVTRMEESDGADD